MILSFRHNGLKLLYQKGDRRKVQPEHADKIERILARLEEASAAGNMDLPGFRLHPLKGDLAGFLVGYGVRKPACYLSIRRRPRQRCGSDRLPLGGINDADEDPPRIQGFPSGMTVWSPWV